MSNSYVVAETRSETFTITHAKHIAAKVAADLKRLQDFFGEPCNSDILAFEKEVTILLKHGALKTITYGFKKYDNWVPRATIRFNAVDGDLVSLSPGGLRPNGADVAGCSFFSFLEYSNIWNRLSESEREQIRKELPFPRQTCEGPSVSGGYWAEDRTYAAGGRGLSRVVLKCF